MSKEQDKSDLDRASWEGMDGSNPSVYIDEHMGYFLTKVKAAFDSNHSYLGFSDAFMAVLKSASIEELQKAKIEAYQIQDSENENVLISNFRSIFKVFLGEKKWQKFERESTKRHLRNDLINGGTPG